MLVCIIGVTIDLQFAPSVPPQVRARIRRAWSRCAAPDGAQASFEVAVSLGQSDSAPSGEARARRRIVADNAALLEQQVATWLTLWAIEIRRSSMWLFHAVGLADGEGRTIGLAAPSHTGKTTVASTWGRQFGYVTDETLAVQPGSLRVEPYPKPLSVIRQPGEPKHQVGPDELGLMRPSGDLRLVRLGLLARQPGIREPRLERIGLREALFELAPQISLLGGRDRPLQALSELIAGLGGAVRVVYGEAADLGEVLGSLMHDPTPVAREWEPAASGDLRAGLGEDPASARARADAATVFRRSPGVADAIWAGGGLVVLSDGTRLSHLEGLGVAIWDALGSPLPYESLRSAVLERMPPPPSDADVGAAVDEAIEVLERQGIVFADGRGDSAGVLGNGVED
ncbi:hypothetical protein [Propionibacterium cyclohexanicum]|nr:hypothetical protein [Propionibacterium cyclohexanicum]